jgi:hypothetical protein
MFTLVKAGLHRAELAEGTFELQRDPLAKPRYQREWSLYEISGSTRICLDTFISTIADGEGILEFILRVETYLRTLGATRSDFYKWCLQTNLGPLHISPHGDRVMMRFRDVGLAKIGLDSTPAGCSGFNPHSGKWNMHWTPEVPMETKLQEFIARMNLIT